MTARDALDALLSTDPRDIGCDAVFDAIDAYVELVVAGVDPEARYPGVAAHLRACPPCGADLDGLLGAVRAEAALVDGRGDAPT